MDCQTLEKAVNSIDQMFFIVDKGHKIVLANDFMVKCFGEEAIRTKHCYELIHGAERPIECCPLVCADKPSRLVVQSPVLDGRYLDLNMFPIKNEQGVVEKGVHVVRDVTLENRLAFALLHNENQSVIKPFLSRYTHDFLNPLSVIISYLQLIKMKVPDVLTSDIKDITIAANRCKDLIDTARKYTICDATIKMPCNVNDIIRELIALISYEYAKDKVSFCAEYAPHPSQVMANPHNLQHVLGSLVINARDAIRAGGKPGSISVKTHVEKNSLVVSVTDTGVGIPEENVPHLFKPFFSTKDKCNGLGLYLSKGMLSAIKGDLDLVESRPGCTTFKVTLPLETKTQTVGERTPPVVY